MRRKSFTAKIKKAILPAVLVVILCASIGMTAIPAVRAVIPPVMRPDIYGPYNINWETFMQYGLEAYTDIDADKLFNGAPFVFAAHAPHESGYGVRYVFNWGDGSPEETYDYDYDTGMPTPSHSWSSTGTYLVHVRAGYYPLSTHYPYYWTDDWNSTSVTVNDRPVLDPDPNTGNPIYGPYRADNFALVPPDELIVGTEYATRIHIYHLAYDDSGTAIPYSYWDGTQWVTKYKIDTGYGVKYEINWGDNTQAFSEYVEYDGDAYEATPSHSWSAPGSYVISGRAGWYPHSNPNSITWSNWYNLTVVVNVNWGLTVLAINNYGQPGYVPLYIDGQYVGTTGYTYPVTEGNHQIGVESPVFDGHYHVFYCYYYDGIYNYDNPMTLSVTGDKTVTACYYTYW